MIRLGLSRGHLWLRIGNYRALWIKDVRRAETVLFSDRYASWHIGPIVVQIFGWPKRKPWLLVADVANARAERLMSWQTQKRPDPETGAR